MGEYLKIRGAETCIINTNHALERMKQRQNSMTEGQINNFFDRVLLYFKDHQEQFESDPYNSEYFFYSGQHQRGMILAYRRDFKQKVSGNHFILVTIYPYGKTYPMQADTPIVYI